MDSPAPPDCPTFDDALRDELLPLVLQHLQVEDLCRAQRVCRRLRDAVANAQGVWQRLYALTWPHQDTAGGKDLQGQSEQERQQTQQRQQQTQQRLQQQQQQQQQQQEQQLPLQPWEPWDQGGRLPGLTAQPQDLAPLPPPQQQVQQGWQGAADSQTLGPGPALPIAPPASSGSSNRKRGRETEPDVRTAAAVAAGATARGAAGATGVNWRELFKARFVEQARRERLKRQARRLKAESALQVLQQEMHRLERALAQEQRLLPALQAELAALQRARQQAAAAALAETFWQPVAVQRAHGVVTDQAPQDAEMREHDLQQRLAVSQLEARKLQAALAARRRRAAEAARKLQALLP